MQKLFFEATERFGASHDVLSFLSMPTRTARLRWSREKRRLFTLPLVSHALTSPPMQRTTTTTHMKTKTTAAILCAFSLIAAQQDLPMKPPFLRYDYLHSQSSLTV